MREDGVFAGRQADVREVVRQLRRLANFNAREIVETVARFVIPADAVRGLPDLRRHLADVWCETQPLAGDVDAALESVARVVAGDQSLGSVFKPRCFEAVAR